MKVDIEKLKAEFEAKIKNAEESNSILDILGDYSLNVSIDNISYLQKGKKALRIRPQEILGKLTIQQVGVVLSKFPSTEKVRERGVDGKDVWLDYKLSTERRYGSSFTELHIWYISGEYDISICFPIELYNELNGCFLDSSRKVEQSEITTYYIVSKPHMKSKDVTVPMKVFAKGEYVKYVGGNVHSVTQWAIDDIIELIKSTCYEK